jgi:hypothetical protein
MRSRYKIEDEAEATTAQFKRENIMIELLLDIRELLQGLQP